VQDFTLYHYPKYNGVKVCLRTDRLSKLQPQGVLSGCLVLLNAYVSKHKKLCTVLAVAVNLQEELLPLLLLFLPDSNLTHYNAQ